MINETTPTPVNPSWDGNSLECLTIDWYSPGQMRIVEIGGVPIEIRFVGRRGRRGRIAITAPSGTVLLSPEVEQS
jgi:hypothetical protein